MYQLPRIRNALHGLERTRPPIVLREPSTDKRSVMLDKCVDPFDECVAPFTNNERQALDWESVTQAGLSNCPLPATLAAIARVCPAFIRAMIIHDLGLGYMSTLKRPGGQGTSKGSGTSVFHIRFPGVDRSQTISPRLHYHPRTKAQRQRGTSSFVEHGNLIFSHASDGAWVSYIEKAYVKMRGGNHYENLDMSALRNADPQSPRAVTVQRVFFDLVGPFTQIDFTNNEILFNLSPNPEAPHEFITTQFQNITDKDLEEILAEVNARPTIATTDTPHSLPFRRHTYVVTGLSAAGVAVSEMMRHTSPPAVQLGNLRREFDTILQAAGDC